MNCGVNIYYIIIIHNIIHLEININYLFNPSTECGPNPAGRLALLTASLAAGRLA